MSLTEFEQLLQRYYEGTCSEKEKEWVDRWLQNTNVNKHNPWQKLSSEERKSYVDNLYSKIERSTGQQPASGRIRTIRKFWWIAAAGCVLFFAGLMVVQKMQTESVQSATNDWVTLEVEPGNRKKITLADGTAVWLQGGSRLSYPSRFDEAERRVKLQGEGYFEVVTNKEKPFVVQSGTLETEVLGTSFNVKAFEQLSEKVISLVEGRLAVRALDTTGLKNNEVLLSAGEVAIFDVANNTVKKNDLPLFDSGEDFKVGRLQFDNIAVDEVLFQLANAYGVRISFDSEKARKHKITATFSISESLDKVLKSIARSTGTRFVRKDKDAIEFKF